MLDWFRANKDILPVLAAVISSLVAVVAVFVGPIVQLIIAHRQFTLTSRQLKLQQKSIALTSAQISANLLGVADQKWIEGFREAVAELDALVNEQGILLKVERAGDASQTQKERLLELRNLAHALISKIALMVGRALPELRFTAKLRAWLAEEDMSARADLANEVFDLAWTMIEKRNARIAAALPMTSANLT